MIYKAGGILQRTNSAGEIEIYIVHRPRYDDWSIPKGHIDAGESAADAAIREILEETGFRCTVLRALPDHEYDMPSGERSHVAMFLCECESGEPDMSMTDGEVDRGEWVAIAEAAERVSYASIAEYLRALHLP